MKYFRKNWIGLILVLFVLQSFIPGNFIKQSYAAEQQYSNFATTTLAADISSGATSLTLASATNFPALGAGEWFMMVLVDSTGAKEIVQCTAITGTTCTIVRGQEGTTAVAHTASPTTVVSLRLTSGTLDRFEGAITDTATNTADIATNDAAITVNAADIATNVTNIATNAGNITTNASGVSTNASNISTNTDDIADISDGTTPFTTTKVRGYFTASRLQTAGTTVILQYDGENRDDNTEYNTSTRVFTAEQAGDVIASACVEVQPSAAGQEFILYIYRNGASYKRTKLRSQGATYFTLNVDDMVPVSVGTTISFYMYCSANTTITGGSAVSAFHIEKAH